MPLSGATLLPQNTAPGSNHPPIYVKLTPAALTTLRSGKDKILVELDGSHACLKIGSTKHAGALTAEPGNLEVYSRAEGLDDPQFKSLGRVLQRLVLRSQRETPSTGSAVALASTSTTASAAATATATAPVSSKKPARRRAGPAVRTSSGNSSGEAGGGSASTSPTASLHPSPESALSAETLERVVHTLAPGRQTPTSLAKSLDIPLEAAMAAVQACANPVESRGPDEMYALRDRAYCDLRVWEWPYSEDQRSAAIERASKAYGRLGLPSDHSARLRLLKPKPRRANRDGSAKSAALQTKQHTEEPTEPKSSEELQSIARKFRETYPEYQKLYTLLSNRRSRPPAQVRRLLNLHRDLEGWKKRLWSSAKNELPADIVMNSR